MQRSKRTNKTTHRSEWRSLLKKDLTGPTLLEMSGNPATQASGPRGRDFPAPATAAENASNLRGAFRIMVISRITGAFKFIACSLLICALVVYGPRAAFAQTTDSSGELTQETKPGSGTPRSSEQAQENQQQPYTQDAATDAGCSIHEFGRDTWTEASRFGHGLKAVPRGAVRPRNLKWELPILAATGVLIAKVDRPADNRIQSMSLQQTAGQWSNVGLGLELGSAVLAYGIGCGKYHFYLRDGIQGTRCHGSGGHGRLGSQARVRPSIPYQTRQYGQVLGRRKGLSVRTLSHKLCVCGGSRSPISQK